MDSKPTLKLDLSIANAEKALDKIVNSINNIVELNECIDIVRLVLKICEHKVLQTEELQKELFKLKSKCLLFEMRKDYDLISHCAELQSELDAAKRRIEELEDLEVIELRETGTQ